MFNIGADVNGAKLGNGNQVTSGELPSHHNAAIVLPGSLFKRILICQMLELCLASMKPLTYSLLLEQITTKQ